MTVSDRFARSSTSSNGSRLDVSSPSDRTMIAWRRISSTFFAVIFLRSLNAVYIALRDLKKITAKNVEEIRRQAIIVLSDGEDTSSLLPFEEVLDLAKRSETVIYTIGLRDNSEGGGKSRGFKEAEFVLRQLAQQTGG